MAKRMMFYAVARGRQVGVFTTWDDCKTQVVGFNGARYKKFPTEEAAKEFIEEHKIGPAKGSSTSGAALAAEGAEIPKKSATKRPKDSANSGGIRGQNNKGGLLSSTNPCCQTTKRELSTLSRSVMDMQASMHLYMAEKDKEFTELGQRIEAIFAKLNNPSAAAATADEEDEPQKPDKPLSRSSSPVPKRRKLNDHTFDMDDEGFVHVFTDGACGMNGNKGAKAGVGVWFGKDHDLNISEPVIGKKATNNTAEIQAAIRAIQVAKEAGVKRLLINTDSMFMINCMTLWIEGWKRKQWKTAKGEDVKNREDLIRLDEQMNSGDLIVRWKHVAGHAGIVGNEGADALAKAGAARYKPQE